jgi:hypothetical protein
MWEGCSGTYILIIEDGGSDRSAFSMQEGYSGTYTLIVEGATGQCSACGRDAVALTN